MASSSASPSVRSSAACWSWRHGSSRRETNNNNVAASTRRRSSSTSSSGRARCQMSSSSSRQNESAFVMSSSLLATQLPNVARNGRRRPSSSQRRDAGVVQAKWGTSATRAASVEDVKKCALITAIKTPYLKSGKIDLQKYGTRIIVSSFFFRI